MLILNTYTKCLLFDAVSPFIVSVDVQSIVGIVAGAKIRALIVRIESVLTIVRVVRGDGGSEEGCVGHDGVG